VGVKEGVAILLYTNFCFITNRLRGIAKNTKKPMSGDIFNYVAYITPVYKKKLVKNAFKEIFVFR